MATYLDLVVLEAMVHYIIRAYSTEPQKLGSTKLHKILWNSEVRCIRKTGHPIAGESFVKRQFGPCAIHLDTVIDSLKRKNCLTVVEPDDEFTARQYLAKGEANKEALSNEQWHILDDTMRYIVDNHTASSISERSHGDVWEATEMYHPMPIQAEVLCFVRPSKEIAGEIERHLATQ